MTLSQLRKQYGQNNVGTLSKGFRIISKDGKLGIYSNELGKMITGFEFDQNSSYIYTTVDDYGENTYKFVNFSRNGKYAYFHIINNKVIQLTPYIYDDPIYFRGRARTTCIINGKYGLIEEGYDEIYEIVPAEYQNIKYSGAGIALQKNNKYGLFTRTIKPMLNKKITGENIFIFDDIILPTNQWDTFKFMFGNIVIDLYKDQFKDKDLSKNFIRKVFK